MRAVYVTAACASNRDGSIRVQCWYLQRVRDARSVTAACADTVNERVVRESSVIGTSGVHVQCA